MTKLEKLEQEAADKGLEIIEHPFQSERIKGLCVDHTIALSRRLRSYKERACVLAEEIAHYDCNVGDILDQSDAGASQQEHRARHLAHDRMIGLEGLIECFRAGDRTIWEMAERLDVTEDFLREALEAYRLRYGDGILVDGCWISFEPRLDVVEMVE